MKRYAVSDFDKLNLHQRRQVVFKLGNFVTKRRQTDYIFALFEIDKILFEIRYNDVKHQVEQIEKSNYENLELYAEDLMYN